MAAFNPHYRFVEAGAESPRAWMLVAHGLLGSGDNWSTFARRLVERRADWGVVLVDLRKHGASQAAPPPHTIASAAADLAGLAARLADEGRPVRAVVGHSLGGKVALGLRARSPAGLAQTWVLDASPGVCPGCAVDPGNPVVRLLAALAQMPDLHPQRAAFVDRVGAAGFPRMVGNWLAKNLVRDGAHYRFAVDLDAQRALLADYYAQDLWPDAEGFAVGESLHFVIAGNSQVVSREDRAMLRRLESESRGQLRVHVLAGASHWLHVDARDRLVDLVAAELRQP